MGQGIPLRMPCLSRFIGSVVFIYFEKVVVWNFLNYL
jgi:hypothetical protein